MPKYQNGSWKYRLVTAIRSFDLFSHKKPNRIMNKTGALNVRQANIPKMRLQFAMFVDVWYSFYFFL
jgi:hypothetical protein